MGIILSGVFLTLVILNRFNPSMGFLTSMVSQIFILVYCLTVFVLGVATIADNRRYAARMHQREEEAERWKKIGTNARRPPKKGE